jgi:hypothetical protein
MARRRKKSYRRKKTAFKLVKGVLYGGAIALPMYTGYNQLGGGADGAIGVIKSAAFVDPSSNKFSLAHGAQIWTPVAALTVVDLATSKLGLQRYISRGLSNLGL